MGGNVEYIGVVAVCYQLLQILHADGLEDPGRGGFQIVQEHGADGAGLIQQSLLAGHV